MCVFLFVYVYMHVHVCCLRIFVFYCVVSRFVGFFLLVFCCVSVGEECFFSRVVPGFPRHPRNGILKAFSF